MRNAIVIMSKVPKPGYTKTRLMERLTGEECAEFHRAMLEDICGSVNKVEAVGYIYYIGGEPEYFSGLDLQGFPFVQQQGIDLGERLFNAAKTILEEYDGVLFLGSDLPEIQPETLERALRYLDKTNVVIGPSMDGGYYLLGLNKPYPALFQNIPWSSSEVFNKTLEAIKNSDLSWVELEAEKDIDTWEDLVDWHGSAGRSMLCESKSLQVANKIMNRCKNDY